MITKADSRSNIIEENIKLDSKSNIKKGNDCISSESTSTADSSSKLVKRSESKTSESLKLSISCDNLRCDAAGRSPAVCVVLQTKDASLWNTKHATETVRGMFPSLFIKLWIST